MEISTVSGRGLNMGRRQEELNVLCSGSRVGCLVTENKIKRVGLRGENLYQAPIPPSLHVVLPQPLAELVMQCQRRMLERGGRRNIKSADAALTITTNLQIQSVSLPLFLSHQYKHPAHSWALQPNIIILSILTSTECAKSTWQQQFTAAATQ